MCKGTDIITTHRDIVVSRYPMQDLAMADRQKKLIIKVNDT